MKKFFLMAVISLFASTASAGKVDMLHCSLDDGMFHHLTISEQALVNGHLKMHVQGHTAMAGEAIVTQTLPDCEIGVDCVVDAVEYVEERCFAQCRLGSGCFYAPECSVAPNGNYYKTVAKTVSVALEAGDACAQ